MKQRKSHVVTAISGDAQPKRVVALAVSAEPAGTPADDQCQREQMTRWACHGWETDRHGAREHWYLASGEADRWWRPWLWALKRGGATWIIAHRAVRVASLLGLWGMIDRGEIQWDGASRLTESGRRRVAGVPAVQHHDVVGRPGRRHGAGDVLPPVPHERTAGARAHERPPAGATDAAASVVIEDPPTILRLRVPGRPGRLWLMDCRNWGMTPPADLATIDAEVTWIASAMARMMDQLDKRGWGGCKATVGSQALATWRRKHMTHQVTAHDDEEILALEEAAYVGGRCECGVIGPVSGPLYWIDRRSAYGHACATVDVPVAVRRRRDGERDEICDDPALAGRCLAEVCVEQDHAACPAAAGDGIRYPVGRVRAVLGGPELQDAVERGAVKRIGRCVEYECATALAGYARDVHDARCEYDRDGDAALASWAKSLLVCLPGKLGQRVADWVPAPDVRAREPWLLWWHAMGDGTVRRLRALSGMVHAQERSGWTYDSCPAAACWILSAARLELLRAIRLAGWAECLYWDTDSLLLTQTGFDRMCGAVGQMGSALGQWRLVRRVGRAIIHGVKHYEHDGEVTCAGMPRADTAATRLPGRYWYRETFGMALSERHAPTAARRLRTYTRSAPYTLGRIGDGGRVYPHVAEDW